MSRGFIIAGTGTDVGKTVFAAALVRTIDGCYWKPVQAGLHGETDSQIVARLSGLPNDRILPEAYRLTTPASPHLAAERDGMTIDLEALSKPPYSTLLDATRPILIEPAGGLLVPLNCTTLQIALFKHWGLPVILCAPTALGAINHSLLSLEALRARDILIHGIAFIGAANEDSERTICEMVEVRRLGRLPHLDPLNAQSLHRAFTENFRREDFL